MKVEIGSPKAHVIATTQGRKAHATINAVKGIPAKLRLADSVHNFLNRKRN
jgi:hypothetical protein